MQHQIYLIGQGDCTCSAKTLPFNQPAIVAGLGSPHHPLPPPSKFFSLSESHQNIKYFNVRYTKRTVCDSHLNWLCEFQILFYIHRFAMHKKESTIPVPTYQTVAIANMLWYSYGNTKTYLPLLHPLKSLHTSDATYIPSQNSLLYTTTLSTT